MDLRPNPKPLHQVSSELAFLDIFTYNAQGISGGQLPSMLPSITWVCSLFVREGEDLPYM